MRVKILNDNGRLPTRNNQYDAGLDIYASEDVFIPVGETKMIKTGISLQIPPGCVGKIEDRSSMALKGLRTGGGVIDCGYNGEISVVLHNFSCTQNGDPVLFKSGYQIKKGDKIAQVLTYEVSLTTPELTNDLQESERGNKGYGSSGR